MKRLVSKYDDEYYTCMLKVLNSLGGRKLKYKWLITDIEAYPQDNGILDKLIEDNRDYLLLTTDELIDYLEIVDFQWIWGVFSAIPMEYSDEEILQYGFPFAENYEIYKENPVIQHPLAEIEVVAHDSCLFQVTARDDEVLEGLRKNYKYISENLISPINLFITNDKRKSSAYYEFQYCKKSNPIKTFLGKDSFGSINHWKKDSLCIYYDKFEEFIDMFPCILETFPINGNTNFDNYGPNYYSKEMTIKIIEEIKRLTNNHYNLLTEWLEKAVDEYNGFYILGI